MEPSGPALSALFDAVTERLVRYVDGLPERPAAEVVDARALAAELVVPPPERGRPLGEVLDQVFDQVVSAGVNPASPGSLSYVNGGGLVHAALAGLIANVTNRFAGFAAAGPGVSAVETAVVQWMADLMGLPPSAGGLLLTGGSMANLTAIVAARTNRLEGPLHEGTVYTSDQAHHSVQKAAMVAGIPLQNVRAVPTDHRFRMRLDLLEQAICADIARGMRPFCLVGTAGTTLTGAVDDLQALSAMARDYGLWFHVDAAYGGFFRLTARGRQALAGIELADSVTLDPHKSLFLPFGTGALLVRDGNTLLAAHQLHSACILDVASRCDTMVNYADLSVEQTREARGLKVWLPLQLLGVGAFREALDEKIDLAVYAAEKLAEIDGLTLLCPPALSTFAFRVAGDDQRNRMVVETVNARGAVHLATAVVNNQTVVRVCVISFRTHADRVQTLIEHIREAVLALPHVPSKGA